MTSADQTILVEKGAFALTVTAPTGNYLVSAVETPAQDPDPAFTTYTAIPAVASVGGDLYASFPEAVTAAAATAPAGTVTLLATVSEPYMLSVGQTLRVILGAYSLSVAAPAGNYVVNTATEGDVTVYSLSDAVAEANGTRYRTFAEAAAAANGTTITLLSNIDTAYTLGENQTLRVILGGHTLTVNAPSENHTLHTSTEGNVTVYTSARLYAQVGGTKYESFAAAVNAANGVEEITLLRDMDSAYSMNSNGYELLRVVRNGHSANVTDYATAEERGGVTYYHKTQASSGTSGSGFTYVAGGIAVAAGTAAIIYFGDGAGGAGATITLGAGATALVEGGGSDLDVKVEDAKNECVKKEQDGNNTRYRNVKLYWVTIDTGISIFDAVPDVWPECIQQIWTDFNQNTSTFIIESSPVSEVLSYTNIKLSFPYPENVTFPKPPSIPDSLNPGNKFDKYVEGSSALSSGTEYKAKPVTGNLEISAVWKAQEAAVVQSNGELVYYDKFTEAAEAANGNVVKILHAPTLLGHYTLRQTSENPVIYEVLKVDRGYYNGECVEAPSNLPSGWNLRTWTYVDSNNVTITCYTVDTQHTVTFVCNNGAADTSQSVYNNQTCTRPVDPTRQGWSFTGWYADQACTQAFDFTTAITGARTLYAGWQLASVARVGETYYATFAEAVTAAAATTPAGTITLVANVPDAYPMSAGQTFCVVRNSFALTVDPPAGSYLVSVVETPAQDPDPAFTTYTAIPAVASVGGTLYATFAEAVTAAAATTPAGKITLLASIPEAWQMTSAEQTIQVIKDGFTLTVNPPAGSYVVTQTDSAETVGEGAGAVTVITTTYAVAPAVAQVDQTLYATLDEALTAAAGKTAVLLADLETTATVTIPTGEVRTLDLSGHGIRTTGANSVLTVPTGATLILTDSSQNVTHKYTVGADGLAAVNDALTGTFETFVGGYITGGTGTAQNANKTVGGGIYVSGGTLTLNAGTILGNKADSGAGVYVDSTGAFTMNGGAIRCNAAENPTNTVTKGPGGGVYVINGTFTMNDGVIRGNTGFSGAGVYLDGNSFTMNGGSITGNAATVYAGGVLINVNRTFRMTGGTISGNTAGSFAGGGIVLDAGGVLELSGDSTISGNTRDGAAENVYLVSGASIKVTDTLSNTTPIGVTMQSAGVFTSSTNTALNDATKFASDGSSVLLAQNGDGQLLLYRPYTVTWLDWDGTLLETDENVLYGVTPSYDGDEPVRATDTATHTVYTFLGWDPAPAPVTDSVTYTAQYETSQYAGGCFIGYSLSLKGDIGVNFFVQPSGDATDYRVVLSWSENSRTVAFSSLNPIAEGQPNAGSYKITANVEAKEMNDTITAILYDGDTVLDVCEYSVSRYARRILANAGGEFDSLANLDKLQILCEAMLIYGAKAQVQFGYHTDDLADAGLAYTLEDVPARSLATYDAAMATDLSCFGLIFEGSSLVLETTTAHRLYFSGTTVEQLADAGVRVNCGNKVLSFIEGTEQYPVCVEIPGMAARNILKNYTVTFTSKDGTIVRKLTVNAGAYIQIALEDQEQSEALHNVVRAIYWYSVAAEAYFGS